MSNEIGIHSWRTRCGKADDRTGCSDRVEGRLFDNHAAIDLARTVFEFGTPEFWKLVQATRVLVLASASQRELPLLVMTFVYADPIDLPTFEEFESAIQAGGGQLLPVYLQCSIDEIVRRVGNQDRAIRRKITSEKGVRDFSEKYKLGPVPRPNCLVLNSEENSAEENAQSITRHYGLADNY